MKHADIDRLAGLDTVQADTAQIADLLNNVAYMRQTQAIVNTLDDLYRDVVYAGIDEIERAKLRGYIIALEQVLKMPDAMKLQAKNHSRRAKSEAERLEDKPGFIEELRKAKESQDG